MKLYAPWEKKFNRIATPFEHFLHAQTTTGLLLIFMTIVALILANTFLVEIYVDFFNTIIDFNIGEWKISHSLHWWINDGLMAIFFFMVGLEIKREILVGELSNIKVAILPILSAIGGMAVPAIIYSIINYNGVGSHGWGIPMATDIAFAVSIIVLLGNRVSPALVTFLVALAIVDDLGAVVIIAIFYTDTINFLPLILSGISFLVLVIFNRVGIHAVLPYFLVGLVMWFFMLESGVHATIAGVFAAMTIPSQPRLTPTDFTSHTKNLLDEYDNYPVATDYTMHESQKAILLNISDRIDAVGSTSARLEHRLHLPVSLIVIPLFALANAGISIDFSKLQEIVMQAIPIGVFTGLILGKVIGIAGTAWLAIKLGIAKLPEGSTLNQIFGVSFLGGVGFTMSIFVADLAFLGQPELIFQAKIGVLVASLVAGTVGYLWLRATTEIKT